MDNSDLSELMIEADFLWREVSIGDLVQVEDAVCEQGVELLSPGMEYMVLMKQQSASGLQSLVVDSNVEDRTVDVHIRRLRKAIGGNGHDKYIQTVRGAGYRFSTRL